MARITINPGHHVELDCGAVGSTGLREVDVNIAVARKLEQLLLEFGHEIHYVQSNDLQEICDLSNSFGANLFVSIHCNAATHDEAHGTETYYCAVSANGEHLAALIQEQIVALGLADRGIKNTGLYVTRHANATAVLVELAFLSNPTEEFMLGNENWQNQFAKAIYQGINEYLEAVAC